MDQLYHAELVFNITSLSSFCLDNLYDHQKLITFDSPNYVVTEHSSSFAPLIILLDKQRFLIDRKHKSKVKLDSRAYVIVAALDIEINVPTPCHNISSKFGTIDRRNGPISLLSDGNINTNEIHTSYCVLLLI